MKARSPSGVTSCVPADVTGEWLASGEWTGETLTGRLERALSELGSDRLAVVQGDVRLTLGDLDRLSACLAGALAERGVSPGDVVCHQLPNWWQAVVVSWAVWRAGGVLAPITPTLREREVGYILDLTDPAVVVVPGLFRGTDHVALVESTGYDGTILDVGSRDFESTLAADPPRPWSLPSRRSDDPAVVLFTSGTTSDPKGVVHSDETLRCETDSLVLPHAIVPDDRLLLPMPVTHVAGLVYGVLFPVLLGTRVILMDRWDAGEALRTIEREKVTFMIGTPVFLRTMMDRPDFAAADLSSLRLWSMGGAGVAPEHVREATEVLGGCWCKRTYGSTEYPTVTTSFPGDPPAACAETDGRAIGAARFRIVDPRTDADLADGSAGEILVRGPEMFVGYLDAGDQEAAFAEEGWFRTGDNGVRDPAGRLTIVGRIKDIIIRGGENISTREVEDAVASHPDVADVAIVRMPDRVMGERACAFVVAAPGALPTLESLREHLALRGLATYKWPERIEVREVLPRTDSGKVRKPALEAEVAALLEGEDLR